MNEQLQRSLSKIRPRPRINYCSQGRAVLATDPEGYIGDFPRQGLYYGETRMLSRYRYYVDRKSPQMVAVSNIQQHSWLGYYVFPRAGQHWKKDTGSGQMEQVSEETVEMKISRTVGFGVHEDIDFTNFTQIPATFAFEIELDADFADLAETFERIQAGRLIRKWTRQSSRSGQLTFDYRSQHRYSHQGNRGVARIHRGLIVQVEKADSPGSYRNSRLRFRVSLAPAKSWHTCIKFIPVFESKKMVPLYQCRQFSGKENELDRKRYVFLNDSTRFETDVHPPLAKTVESALSQAKADLASLRLPDMDHGEQAWVPAAGLPIYIALFGRDTLTVAWQAAMASAAMMVGALRELPRWQGKIENDWRDEQPGRMLHEAHTGPLASLFYNPRTRYYGAATPSSFYPIVLSELWRWTGDKNLITPLIKPALRALRWKDQYTDLFGDGFYAYRTLSTQGTTNQGWKDSGDAIVYENGRQVAAPISTCEEQAYVYLAKLRMAEMLWFLGEREEACRLFDEAIELKKRFNDRFWMPEKSFYALGLDAKRKQIRSISSNPGHLLSCGIVPKEYAGAVARRLLRPDMFSGWGVRTLSADHPAYDPYSYHRGSVWPAEHGNFALGFMQYGLTAELHTMARAMFESTTLFDYNRLPECFSGHPRDAEHPIPALYPKANWPQAWSSSCLFAIVQAMLGLCPFAPAHLLYLDPRLPDWLPEITLGNLHVGKSVCSIRFFRKGKRTHFEVLDRRGKLHIRRQPGPWALAGGSGGIRRVMDALLP